MPGRILARRCYPPHGLADEAIVSPVTVPSLCRVSFGSFIDFDSRVFGIVRDTSEPYLASSPDVAGDHRRVALASSASVAQKQQEGGQHVDS